MKGFCPLASGSKGNCIYIGTQQTKVLLDAGLSAKQIKQRLAEIDVDLSEIDAILITHEHFDHIQGLKVLAFKYGIPIFANHETAKGIVETFQDCPKFKIFSTGEPFEYGDMAFHPFSIQHDTPDPVAFTVQVDSLKLGFCTDLGCVTSSVVHHLQKCDYLYLEANHEEAMVEASHRPHVYKRRVLGRFGHLSNTTCARDLLLKIAHDKLQKVYLAHLSEECNREETALNIVQGHLQSAGWQIPLRIAPQRTIAEPTLFQTSVN